MHISLQAVLLDGLVQHENGSATKACEIISSSDRAIVLSCKRARQRLAREPRPEQQEGNENETTTTDQMESLRLHVCGNAKRLGNLTRRKRKLDTRGTARSQRHGLPNGKDPIQKPRNHDRLRCSNKLGQKAKGPVDSPGPREGGGGRLHETRARRRAR